MTRRPVATAYLAFREATTPNIPKLRQNKVGVHLDKGLSNHVITRKSRVLRSELLNGEERTHDGEAKEACFKISFHN